MKKTIILFTLFLISAITKVQSQNLCNMVVTSVNITGNVSLTENGLNYSEACITITGTADLCDDNGKILASGLTLTVQSEGCKRGRMSNTGTSPDNLFIPFELLGDVPEFEGREIPMVYPNPNNGIFTLKTKTINLKEHISIVSLSSGEKISAAITTSDKGYSIDLSNYPSGIYVLTFSKDGLDFSQKIIKK